MRTNKLEHMRPAEIVAERERKSIVYLAIGPLEWHGLHLPFGTDPLDAYELALMLAEKTGGVVMPTLFCGTERERSPEIVASFGFENPNQYIVGMDIPANSVPSMYFREDIFGLIVREHLRLLVNLKYKLIVLLNGHGAENQVNTLHRLAVEFSSETSSKVIDINGFLSAEESGEDMGHACRYETSLQMSLFPENVDFSGYPSRDVPLKYKDYSVVDDGVFRSKPNKNFTVEYDPRDANPEIGKRCLKLTVDKCAAIVEEQYKPLK